jgi:hypothetical protein
MLRISVYLDEQMNASVALSLPDGTPIDDVFVFAHRLGRAYGVQDTEIIVHHPFPFADTQENLITAWNRFVMSDDRS